jgi:hypothetical protein
VEGGGRVNTRTSAFLENVRIPKSHATLVISHISVTGFDPARVIERLRDAKSCLRLAYGQLLAAGFHVMSVFWRYRCVATQLPLRASLFDVSMFAG